MSEQTEIAGEPTYGSQQPSAMKAAERPWCLSSEEWVRNYVLRPPPEVLEPRATEADYVCRGNKTVIPGGTPFATHARGGMKMPRESTGLRSPLPGLPSVPRNNSGVSSDAGDVEAASSGIASQPDPSPASRSAPHAGGLAKESVAALPYLRLKPPKKSQRKG